MKTKSTFLLALITMAYSLSSCQIVSGIFKAGVWTGIIIVVIVIALIIFLISKAFSK